MLQAHFKSLSSYFSIQFFLSIMYLFYFLGKPRSFTFSHIRFNPPVTGSSFGNQCVIDPNFGPSLLFQMLLLPSGVEPGEFLCGILECFGKKLDLQWA